MTPPLLRLKPGRDESVLRRHPWIFAGAVARVEGAPAAGETVEVRSAQGKFVARAAYNSQSQIAGRIWTWDEAEAVDADFFRRRIEQAIARRTELISQTDAARWVNAENDGLPGVIVDRYGTFVVCQFLSAGVERWKSEIAGILASQEGVAGVFERSDADVRTKEGLASATGVLSGDAPPELIEIREGSSKYLVDVHHGHKTGFYLDQRENRSAVAQIARGRECLNCFCYTGAFTVPAFSGGAAAVTSMDSSGPALEIAKKNLDLNGLPHGEIVEGDVFGVLRQYRDSDRKFDFIILDPPKFVHSKGQIEKGARAYKDINWLAMRLLRPGGLLMTFSCSGLVSEDLFQKILFGAALDSGREVRIIRRLGQATDHPVALTFPEGNYLKGFLLQAD